MISSNEAVSWESLFESLNPQQKEAVLFNDNPQLIVAGAGSGKTRVLMVKVVYLIQKFNIKPENILAITFTNKAADEMKERLLSFGIRIDVGTFHATALRILRSHGHYIGLEKNMVVYDEQDQKQLIKNAIEELASEMIISEKPADAVEWISRKKDDLIEPDDALISGNSSLNLLYKKYNEKLAASNAIDFGGIILETIKLLKQYPDLCVYYQNKWNHILVDEYQDTNIAQAEFLKLLVGSNKNLTVVGDPDQSIYGWRGANIDNILHFHETYPAAKLFKLEQNYRSTSKILSATNNLIENNLTRHDKSLWTDNDKGPNVKAVRVHTDREEAQLLCDLIDQHHMKGIPYKEMAVFYRMHSLSRLLEDVFLRNGIPYSIVGGLPFYQRKEIKDVISYLRVMFNQSDIISWRRIINIPTRGIGKKSFEKILDFSITQKISFLDSLRDNKSIPGLSKKVRRECSVLYELLTEYKNKLTGTESWEMEIENFFDKIGYIPYLEYVETEDKSLVRINNVRSFFEAVYDYKKNNPSALLEDFLETVSIRSGVDDWEEKEDKVSLMTLHCAKGLEFNLVFLIGLEEGVLPYIRDTEDAREIEEERRLCYVGMTRAKENLYLLSSKKRFAYASPVYAEESRFIGEIPDLKVERSAKSDKPKKYYKPVKYDIPACDEKFTHAIDEFSPGDYVYHYDLGKGQILGGSGEGKNKKLVVLFDGDDKPQIIMAAYAGLTRLDE